jgi:hypothetical protein
LYKKKEKEMEETSYKSDESKFQEMRKAIEEEEAEKVEDAKNDEKSVERELKGIIGYYERVLKQNSVERQIFFYKWSRSTWVNFVEQFRKEFLPEKNRLRSKRYRIEEEFQKEVTQLLIENGRFLKDKGQSIYTTYVKRTPPLQYQKSSPAEDMFINVDDYINMYHTNNNTLKDPQQTVDDYLKEIKKATNSPLNRRRSSRQQSGQ